jgi:hypothetical protein
MVDPRLEGHLNEVAEPTRSPSPVREAGKEKVMRKDRRGWRRFLEKESNEERGVKDEGHGHGVTGGSCLDVAMNIFKNIEKGCRVCFTDGVHNSVRKVRFMRVICS